MYKIMATEIYYRQGKRIPLGKSFEFECHKDLLNATVNMNYLHSCFGKHYNFYLCYPKEDFPYKG